MTVEPSKSHILVLTTWIKDFEVINDLDLTVPSDLHCLIGKYLQRLFWYKIPHSKMHPIGSVRRHFKNNYYSMTILDNGVFNYTFLEYKLHRISWKYCLKF